MQERTDEKDADDTWGMRACVQAQYKDGRAGLTVGLGTGVRTWRHKEGDLT